MKTVYLITCETIDSYESSLDFDIVCAFFDHEAAKAELISLRKQSKGGERYGIEEIVVIESVRMMVN